MSWTECARVDSETKHDTKGSQYRGTVLRRTSILVDVVHTLPPEIEALLPSSSYDPLDSPHTLPSSAASYAENAEESARTSTLADSVSQLAAVRRKECRKLACFT